MRVLLLLAIAACVPPQQRFPDDVQASLAHAHVMRLQAARFDIYYPDGKRAEVDRFLAHAERCADEIQRDAPIALGDKLRIAMPDTPFDNAFVLPAELGYEAISVIPLHATLDFTTEFGLPPDPGYVACHELVHYIQFGQIAGLWTHVNALFGPLWTPQAGFDAWFLEGLATHYEAALQPDAGRPRWPIFTGMFAAAYAGGVGLTSGELSEYGRNASVGHHYLVGTMFLRYLSETYGEKALWAAIGSQARGWTGLFFAGSFDDAYGKSFGTLFDEFVAWTAREFPVRAAPATQHRLATAGNDARYARLGEVEAWIADDVDQPSRLFVRRRGETVTTGLVEVVPPRKLVEADPLLISGLSITTGGDVWFTVVDQGATYNTTRLLRWHDGALAVIANDLGPGATISPDGATYYYCAVDGDRWSLAAYDTATRARREVRAMTPGHYILGAQVSRDAARLVANVWDGRAFVAWILDARTGATLSELAADGPIYDASFTDDGRVLYLGEVAGRFQVMVDGRAITDVPYAALAPREAGGTVRFLDREGWRYDVAEVPLPGPAAAPTYARPPAPAVPWLEIPILADDPYCPWQQFFRPQVHAPTFLQEASLAPHYGFVLAGGDPLEYQRWQIAGYVQPPVDHGATHGGATVDYLNLMLAPVSILASASLIDWAVPLSGSELPEERRTRDLSLTVSRVYRGSLLASASAIYTDDLDRFDGETRRTHLGGPQVAVSWLSAESTRASGIRRGFAASLQLADYPRALSSLDANLVDAGGSLTLFAPLPARGVLTLGARGRSISGAPGFLQLGGDSGVTQLYQHSSQPAPPELGFPLLPPNLRFVEALRGYEDRGIATNRAALADVSVRVPFVIDRGRATTLWYLPASFVRELDLELFAAGALDGDHRRHAAVGAAMSLRLSLFRVPLVLQYQLARRVRDDDALTQLVSLGPDL